MTFERLQRLGKEKFQKIINEQKWVYYRAESAVGQIGRVSLDASGKPEPIPGSTSFRGYLGGREMSISAGGSLVELAPSETCGQQVTLPSGVALSCSVVMS